MRAALIHWLTWIVGSSVSAWYSGQNITRRAYLSLRMEDWSLTDW